MINEADKTFAEADGEVSEAIDFARYYGDQALELDSHDGLRFQPLGVMAVIPPWNFPVAIPTGGVMASIAAGNSVIFKPAPETPRCAEIVAEAAWAAGVQRDLLQFVRTPDNDVGRHLVTSADGVILTGSAETAQLFRSWKPELRLFAETSGKNALIISQNADIDLAVADLVHSAFSHSGQKCSAASLAIVIGDTYESERFRRQLADAVRSINVAPATMIEADLAPLISEPNDRLARALTSLEPGEQWLVEPSRLDHAENLWSPGVRLGVRPGSWFQQTECFGPVLGVMQAADLDEAINIQNSTDFGLTGGIHTLDPEEIARWLARVEVGNAYVNRAITGAIVQRQPFGGWKRSSVGPSAKAGGPNYLGQLGTWRSADEAQVPPDDTGPLHDYQQSWDEHFSKPHDPTGLFCEANVFRYVPLDRVLLRVEAGATAAEIRLVRTAASIAGVSLIESDAAQEDQAQLATRLDTLKVERIRFIGGQADTTLRKAAAASHTHIADGEVTPVGRVELQHYLREQAISETLHRFGNLTMQR
jgi:RHH-type proline utilization regulon transcriptional repressor/proline dehydrogenase/delta 1-pyrroline-5-carboxylate dehydrogenase